MFEETVVATTQVRFNYARVGAGPPVVLLPGGGGWRLTFEALATQLSQTCTVYALDPPGQGRTRVTDPAFGFDVDAIAHSIDEFLVATSLDHVAVVGHSWGGGFAARLAELHPARTSRLVLIAPGGLDVDDVWEFRLLRLPIIGEIATRLTSTTAARHMMRKAFARPERIPHHLLADAARALRTEPGAAALRRDMLRVERAVTWAQTERDLHLIDCPTLIVWGEYDRYFPVHLLDRFARRLRDVETHTVPGAGHFVHGDQPGLAVPLITRFLAAAQGADTNPAPATDATKEGS